MHTTAALRPGSMPAVVSRRRSRGPHGPRRGGSITAPPPAPLRPAASVTSSPWRLPWVPVTLPVPVLLDVHRAAPRRLVLQGQSAPRVVLATTPPHPNVPTALGKCLGTMVQLHGAMARPAPRVGDTTGIPSAAFHLVIRTIVVSRHRNHGPCGPYRGGSATAPPPVSHSTAVNVQSSTRRPLGTSMSGTVKLLQ